MKRTKLTLTMILACLSVTASAQAAFPGPSDVIEEAVCGTPAQDIVAQHLRLVFGCGSGDDPRQP